MGFFGGFLEVFFDCGEGGDLVEVDSAFKVMVEAAVIHINAAYGGYGVVGDEDFAVDEAGEVAVDFYSGFD